MLKIVEYTEDKLENFKRLYTELMIFEKSIYPERGEPTEKFMNKLCHEMIKEVSEKQGKIYLAYIDGEPVGFIAGYVAEDIENNTDYFRIDSLVTTEKFRNQGIAGELINKIEDYAKSIGQTKVGLGVLSGNTSAYQYYKKLGFEDYAIEMLKNL